MYEEGGHISNNRLFGSRKAVVNAVRSLVISSFEPVCKVGKEKGSGYHISSTPDKNVDGNVLSYLYKIRDNKESSSFKIIIQDTTKAHKLTSPDDRDGIVKFSSVDKEDRQYFFVKIHMEGEMAKFSIRAPNGQYLQSQQRTIIRKNNFKLILSDDATPLWSIVPL